MELIAILLIVLAVVLAERLLYRRLVLKNVEYSVRFNTDEAFEGETIEIVEEVVNRKWLPVPWLKTELSTSRWLEFTGSAAARASDVRFVPSVFALRPYQRCTRTRTAVARKRGCFRLENTSLIGSDLLGLVSVSRNIRVDSGIRILPAPYEVGVGELSARELTGELIVRRFICDDPFLRAGAREYTGREPMNRIDWSATARSARLMAFQNDFTTENRVLLLLNLQRSPIGEPRPPMISDTETMIKAAAFLLSIFAERSDPVDLATNGAGRLYLTGGAESEDYLNLLRALAELENTCETDFADFFNTLSTAAYTDLVILTPYLDERLVALAREEKRLGRNVLFYCNGEGAEEYGAIPLGRLHRYLFIDD
ncbi:MAG: DUF58 domain-containing protein [Bacteroides sp.]|nr:DUF58 domain-containing protein [Eubacterium sp.]MCM1419537.1 DUF58 domain-containing protein [Roseburia sp.]MCM1463477.1 DUF58 domain-containing protein [Bacteroides sp.]